jgi:hypothetical protein
MAYPDNIENNNDCSTLDSIIKEVKRDFRSILVKRKELVLKLGNAFEGAVSDPESICEEIKNTLKEEIAAKLISARNIEIYCPDKWKRKTRPKNEKTSFSCIQEDKEKTLPKTIAIDTQGVAVDEESVPLKSADANTKGHVEDNLQRIEKHDIKGTNKLTGSEELVDVTTFPKYQEILIQNNELKEALEKATQLVQTNTIHDNSTVDFEFSLSYEDVQSYVSSMFKVGTINKIWFNGRLDKQTGRVIYAQMGTIADDDLASSDKDRKVRQR